MTLGLLVIVIIVIAVVAIVVGVVLARRPKDAVDSFRRQIDALSPEARRPVVDQVQNAANRIDPRPVERPADNADSTDDATDGADDVADESDDDESDTSGT